MNRIPHARTGPPSIVYDKIEQLGNAFRASGDLGIIDNALAYHKKNAAD